MSPDFPGRPLSAKEQQRLAQATARSYSLHEGRAAGGGRSPRGPRTT